jgi:hypothetical protein
MVCDPQVHVQWACLNKIVIVEYFLLSGCDSLFFLFMADRIFRELMVATHVQTTRQVKVCGIMCWCAIKRWEELEH